VHISLIWYWVFGCIGRYNIVSGHCRRANRFRVRNEYTELSSLHWFVCPKKQHIQTLLTFAFHVKNNNWCIISQGSQYSIQMILYYDSCDPVSSFNVKNNKWDIKSRETAYNNQWPVYLSHLSYIQMIAQLHLNRLMDRVCLGISKWDDCFRHYSWSIVLWHT